MEIIDQILFENVAILSTPWGQMIRFILGGLGGEACDLL